MNSLELAIHRKGTLAFIEADSRSIVLEIKAKTTHGGSVSSASGGYRDAQDFRVIYPGDLTGLVSDGDKTTRRFDFVLVGAHDAQIAINDCWTEESGQAYSIDWIFRNDYETKAGGYSHGRNPN